MPLQERFWLMSKRGTTLRPQGFRLPPTDMLRYFDVSCFRAALETTWFACALTRYKTAGLATKKSRNSVVGTWIYLVRKLDLSWFDRLESGNLIRRLMLRCELVRLRHVSTEWQVYRCNNRFRKI